VVEHGSEKHCCAAAAAKHAKAWSYFPDSHKCELFHPAPGSGVELVAEKSAPSERHAPVSCGPPPPPPTPTCQCKFPLAKGLALHVDLPLEAAFPKLTKSFPLVKTASECCKLQDQQGGIYRAWTYDSKSLLCKLFPSPAISDADLDKLGFCERNPHLIFPNWTGCRKVDCGATDSDADCSAHNNFFRRKCCKWIRAPRDAVNITIAHHDGAVSCTDGSCNSELSDNSICTKLNKDAHQCCGKKCVQGDTCPIAERFTTPAPPTGEAVIV